MKSHSVFVAGLCLAAAIPVAAVAQQASSEIKAEINRQQATPEIRSSALSQLSDEERLIRIREKAIAGTLVRLERLRPYASDFDQLQQAVRAYWQQNVTSPDARVLANTIIQYVKVQYRLLASSQIHAGARDGVARVKAALR